MARINGAHHVAMSVPSLETAREFYEGWLGLEVVSSFDWRGSPTMDTVTGLAGSAGRMIFLSAGNLLLELFEYETPTQAPGDPTPPPHRHGITHLCLDVDDALAIHAELSAKGMRFLSDPVTSPRVCTVYGRDPFGNILELQQIKDPDMPTPIVRT
jgi:catechol 2,3-dioxygenase-like lactoylglutathione lyase family enzyme